MNIPGSIDAELRDAYDNGKKEGKAEAIAIIRARISYLASIDGDWAAHHFRALREIAEEIEAE